VKKDLPIIIFADAECSDWYRDNQPQLRDINQIPVCKWNNPIIETGKKAKKLHAEILPQVHADSIELHFVYHGEIGITLENKFFLLRPGDVLAVLPGQTHSSAIINRKTEFGWLRMKLPGKKEGFAGFSSEETDLAFDVLQSGKIFNIGSGLRLADTLHAALKTSCSMNTALSSPRSSYARLQMLQEMSVKTALQNFLVMLIQCTEQHRKPEVSPAIRVIEDYIAGNYAAAFFPIGDFSEKLEMAPSTIMKQFKKETGYALHEYLLKVRISAASQMLSTTSESMTDIAYKCGFYSSQHFSAMFRRFTGQTPRLWRKNNNK